MITDTVRKQATENKKEKKWALRKINTQ
jgi:hypothetical protein